MIIDNNTSDVKTLIENTIKYAKESREAYPEDPECGIAITCIKTASNGDQLRIVADADNYGLAIQYFIKEPGDFRTVEVAKFRYDFWDIRWIVDMVTFLKNNIEEMI